MESLKGLLINQLIYKETDRDLYYRIKDNIRHFKSFLTDKLGYELIVRSDFIRLLKLPGIPDFSMGVQAFQSGQEYAMFMLLLIFLEDRGKEEQFLLSHVSEFLLTNEIGEEYDWTNYSTRKMLIRVIKYAESIHLLKVDDGSENDFIADETQEILFESTGISRYLIKNLTEEFTEHTLKWDEVIATLISDHGESGVHRKNRVYQRLLLSPIVYRGDAPGDYEYIKNYRNFIEDDFEKYLGWKLHVHKNGALLIPPDRETGMECFPSSKALSDIILLVCAEIRQRLDTSVYQLSPEDHIHLSKDEFHQLVMDVRIRQLEGFSKEYREMSADRFFSQVLEEMERFQFLKTQDDTITLLPLCGKISGMYYEDFLSKGEHNE